MNLPYYHQFPMLPVPPPLPDREAFQFRTLKPNFPFHSKPLDRFHSNFGNNNNVLQVRNLSPAIPYQERDQVLYGLGATSVHNYPFYTIAYFHNESACHTVIRTLHQRMWNLESSGAVGQSSQFTSKRLRVEFLPPNQTESRIVNAHIPCDSSLKREIRTGQEEVFRDAISGASSSVHNFGCQSSGSRPCSSQPFTSKSTNSQSSDLKFNFPSATASVIRRISAHLLNDTHFYHHVLLLMVRLKLRPPFDEDNPYDNDNLIETELPIDTIPLPKTLLKRVYPVFPNSQSELENLMPKHDNLVCSDESELEDDHELNSQSKISKPKRRKIKKKKGKSLKIGMIGTKEPREDRDPNNPIQKITTSIDQVFDDAPTIIKSCPSLQIKKISTSITNNSNDLLPKETLSQVSQSTSGENTGNFGVLDSHLSEFLNFDDSSHDKNKKKEPVIFDLTTLSEDELITDLDLERNCLSMDQLSQVKAYKGFRLEEPSQRLYVKNLPNRGHTFAEVHRELYRLFGKFVQLYNHEHLDSFNIVYLSGRMHGQAFVTFPSVAIAQEAVRRTQGYKLFQDRPLIVNFSKSKKATEVAKEI